MPETGYDKHGLLAERNDGTRPTNCDLLGNPDVMFPTNEEPVDGRGRPNRELAEARAVCVGCWFRQKCGEEAIERREPFGIWGGMTYREREAARRRKYPRRDASRDQEETLFDVELAG
jgi:hypothetical protein